jgi:hypothetical protein
MCDRKLTDPIAVGTAMLTPDEVEKLIEKNKKEGLETEIYNWEFPEKSPDFKVLTMDVLLERIKLLLTEVAKTVRNRPDLEGDDNQLHDIVVGRKNPILRDLSRSHPHLVKMLCVHKQDPKKLEHTLRLMQLRQDHETSRKSVEEKSAEVSAYFNTCFMPKK